MRHSRWNQSCSREIFRHTSRFTLPGRLRPITDGKTRRNIKMAARVGSERFPDINGGLPQTKIRETLLPALRQREEILPLCKFEPIHFLQLLCTPCRALPSSPGPARPPTALKGQSGPPDHHSCPQLCTVQVGSSNYATMTLQPPGRW